MTEPLPCPFCGHPARVGAEAISCFRTDDCAAPLVLLDYDDGHGVYRDEARSIRNWNTRAPVPWTRGDERPDWTEACNILMTEHGPNTRVYEAARVLLDRVVEVEAENTKLQNQLDDAPPVPVKGLPKNCPDCNGPTAGPFSLGVDVLDDGHHCRQCGTWLCD
jgi:hypothetical protein